MKVMIVYNLVLLIFFVTYSKCHEYQQQQNHNDGIKGQTGHSYKSYGGYFPDTSGYNEAANNFVNNQNYYHPQTIPYQPYGWNFNQPSRTYGGVNLGNQNDKPQPVPDNRIGWSNNNNYARLNPNPFFPTMPQLNIPFPTFVPQFPFPTFPNVFPFQNNFVPSYSNYPSGPHISSNNNQENGYVHSSQGPLPYPQSNTNQGFPTPNTNNGEINRPNHEQFPQPNIYQGIPEGNINRSPEPNNLGPNKGRPNFNQIATTERIQNKAGGPSTFKPLTTTLGIDSSDEVADFQTTQNFNRYRPTTNKPVTSTILNTLNGGDISNEDDLQVTQKPNRLTTRWPATRTTTISDILQAEDTSDEEIDHQVTQRPNLNKPTTSKPTTTTADTVLGGNDNNEGVDYQFPQNPDFSKPNTDNSSDIDIRGTGLNRPVNKTRFTENDSDTEDDNSFASNSFFEDNYNREWTNDDEQKWLATTKAPYFENKVPGLECTLPAAAVLGAKTAFKVSTLLPLDVPPGKPLLSCNATDLLQSRIHLDGKIYECSNNDIILSCLRHGGFVDECEGHILPCDIENLNVEKVWCTNGTLVSSTNIECKNAFVESHKSTLNCLFKHTRVNPTRPTVINILPVVPLPTPENIHAGLDNRNEDDFDYGDIDEKTETDEELMPQVKSALKNVFPHDLLTMPSTNYLPPQTSKQSINPMLKNHINSVFNTDMLATALTENEDEQVALRSQDTNIKTSGNGVVKTKTASPVSRFGGNNDQQRHNLHDRLIFTD